MQLSDWKNRYNDKHTQYFIIKSNKPSPKVLAKPEARKLDTLIVKFVSVRRPLNIYSRKKLSLKFTKC